MKVKNSNNLHTDIHVFCLPFSSALTIFLFLFTEAPFYNILKLISNLIIHVTNINYKTHLVSFHYFLSFFLPVWNAEKGNQKCELSCGHFTLLAAVLWSAEWPQMRCWGCSLKAPHQINVNTSMAGGGGVNTIHCYLLSWDSLWHMLYFPAAFHKCCCPVAFLRPGALVSFLRPEWMIIAFSQHAI